MPRFIRRQDPPKFANYRRYKPYLREDFLRRCAYCEFKEILLGTSHNFVVEHFQPRSIARELECEYSNLYYVCNVCNAFKSDHWPNAAQLQAGYRFADPCTSTPYQDHYLENDDGTLIPISKTGFYTCFHLQLDREQLIVFRLLRRDMRTAITRAEEQLSRCQPGRKRREAEVELARLKRLYIRLFL